MIMRGINEHQWKHIVSKSSHWVRVPSVTGPNQYFYYRRLDSIGQRQWIVWDRVRSEYVFKFETFKRG